MITYPSALYSTRTADNKIYTLRARPLRWVACSALRAEDALRPAKRELGFAGLGQALRADFGLP